MRTPLKNAKEFSLVYRAYKAKPPTVRQNFVLTPVMADPKVKNPGSKDPA
jgi:hypothetical protein